jgi:hypothetical protein
MPPSRPIPRRRFITDEPTLSIQPTGAPFQYSKGIAQQTAEQIMKQNQGAMENYFSWLQNTMSVSPWGSTDLNKKLPTYATENVTAAVTFVQKLSQAKDLQDVIKIQTEFVQMQIDTFNQRAKELGEAVMAATKKGR